MTEDTREKHPTRFGFFLVDNFTMISMASAIEPLRMANRIIRRQHFSWKIISETGKSIVASDGLSVNADYRIDNVDAIRALDVIVVCGGSRIEVHLTGNVLKWLRSLGQSGACLGSVCTGSYALAAAGLLDGYRCSVHWENIASLTDAFPQTHVSRSVFTIDRDRFTCSGGTSPIDMMLYFIRKQLGSEVSTGVAEQFIYERIRHSSDDQRIPLKHVYGNQSEKLVIAVELMEANIREPIHQADLASYVGISKRQLQRLFQRYLSSTPSRYYLRIRLARARELLQQTSMNLVEIATLTGFVSSSHFSKSYKEYYGKAPSHERRLTSA